MSNRIFAGLFGIFLLITMGGCGEGSGGGTSGDSLSSDGTAGSMARFALVGDYLYTISGSALQLYDIEEPSSPNPWVKMYLDWDIETLFPYEDYLLVGSESGVHILDNSTPGSPRYITEFSHARSCDPVVAENGIGYVTLSSGSSCRTRGLNQLDVLDLSDITKPKLIRTYPMQEPKGLAIDGKWLFVCDGSAGLKVFDVTQPNALSVADKHPSLDCFDVIAKDNRLYVSVENSLVQFSYETMPMTRLSEWVVGG